MSQSAIDLIRAERVRQIVPLAYTAEKDNGRGPELTSAGICYLNFALDAASDGADAAAVPATWPWSTDSWKPRSPRRALVKAGALFIAALDVLPSGDKTYTELAQNGLVQVTDTLDHLIETEQQR